MVTLKCGCVLTENIIHFQKKFYDENGMPRDAILVRHTHQNFVNVCGKCGYKQKMINEAEEIKLKIAKKQFDVLVGNCEIIEPESEEEPEVNQ